MPIFTNNPIVVPQKIYGVWWIKDVHISAPDPSANAPFSLNVVFQLMTRDENGVGSFAGPEKTMLIADINQLADNGIQSAIQLVTDTLGILGQSQNIIS